MKKKIKLIGFSLALVALLFLFLPLPVSAQTAYSIEDIGTTIGLGTADLKTTVINIIQWVLGILALVAVVVIIIGGFIVATSKDPDRTGQAKRLIVGALIGLVIVLLAWAIVIFVAGTAANVTE